MLNALSTRAKIILVVDDEASSRFLISTLLSLYQFDVLQAGSGKEALKIAHEQAVDLILLDIMMPEMDGFMVCERLKKDPETKRIPVIFVSALIDDESRANALMVGGDGYVNKPFVADELVQLLSQQPTMILATQSVEMHK
jgi:CheY-like chemotaxis protein